MPSAKESAYQVINRLAALRDLLRESPQTRAQIAERLPEYYTDDASGARKLRRDLHCLESWGYHVTRNRAAKTYALSRRSIEADWSAEELEALAALRASFKRGLPYAETLQNIFQRIEQGLTDEQRQQFARKPTLRIRLTPVEKPSPVQAVQHKLERALRLGQRISFRYRPLGKEESIHPDDEPIEIEYHDDHYYLVAYCYQARSILEYRLDRIAPGSIQILPARAEGNWKRHLVDFKYRLFPRLASGGATPRFPEIVAFEPQKDGSLIITARGYSEFWIIREILRYGEQAEILGPPALRAQFKRTVEAMAELYSRAEVAAAEDGWDTVCPSRVI